MSQTLHVSKPRTRQNSTPQKRPRASKLMRRMHVFNEDAKSLYSKWPTPTVIVSDGPYGLGMFKEDPTDPESLVDFYEPHIRLWSKLSAAYTTLWFWNTEIGWATVHPVLKKHGWKYVNCNVWNKGIAHVAGNINTGTIRRFPVVTEVCVQYVLDANINGMTIKEWLRSEWARSGLPFARTNDACGLKNAATRKYFTKDDKWYFPPGSELSKIAKYANANGEKSGRPYFSLNGRSPVSEREWNLMRSKFYCDIGVTNVWDEPPLHGSERVKDGVQHVHCNQKPLKLISRIVESSSDPRDIVWEPFGGLCTAAVSSALSGRTCYSAEIDPKFYARAVERLSNV